MFNKIAAATLILALSAQPALAASLDLGLPASGQQMSGAFAGGRLRLSLGAAPKASAALAIAPIGRTVGGDGAVRMRFGEGVTLGVSGYGPVALRLAGTRVDRLGVAPNGRLDENAPRHGISTLGYVAIGVGVLAVAAFLALDACADGEICGGEGDDHRRWSAP